MRERSDVRKMYLHTKGTLPFLLSGYDCIGRSSSHRVALLPPRFSRLFTYRILSYTFSPRVFDTPRSPPIPDRERGLYTYASGPLNLTWQVPAEWTQLGPHRSPRPLPHLPSFLPASSRCRAVSDACLTFSVFPIYGRLLSAFFTSLPRDDGCDRSCLLYGTQETLDGRSLNHLQRVALR